MSTIEVTSNNEIIEIVTGATGPSGPTGPQGETGPAGLNGDGDVNGPASATTGNLTMFGDTSGKVLSDSGQSYVKLIDGPMYAREYGLMPRGSYPGNTTAASDLALLKAGHNASISAGRLLELPAGDIWTYGTSTAEFELGNNVNDISRGGGWISSGRCQIHTSYIDDTSNGPEVIFGIKRGSLVGDLSNTNFWLGELIHFITDNDGPQIQIGYSGDGADNIFYNKTKFEATIRSNLDNAANELLTLYSYYDALMSGQINNAGASNPAVGSVGLKLLGGVECTVTGTFGGLDVGMEASDGGASLSNTAVKVLYANFEQCRTDFLSGSGTIDAYFQPSRATAFNTIVDARDGSTGTYAPINAQQEAGGSGQFQGLKLQSAGVQWKGADGWVHCHLPEIDFDGSNTPVKIFEISIPEGLETNIEFEIRQMIKDPSAGFEGFRYVTYQEIFATRQPGANVIISDTGTVIHNEAGQGALSFVANTTTQKVEAYVIGTANQTFQTHNRYRARQLGYV